MARTSLVILAALFVLCVIVKSDEDVNRIDDEKQPISADNADINERIRRSIWRGTYKQNSNKKQKYHRKSFTHKMTSDPDGKVSIDTKHHHEKGGMAEESNKSGVFTLGNRKGGFGGAGGGQGWFDNEDDDGMNVF